VSGVQLKRQLAPGSGSKGTSLTWVSGPKVTPPSVLTVRNASSRKLPDPLVPPFRLSKYMTAMHPVSGSMSAVGMTWKVWLGPLSTRVGVDQFTP
jgi:hypothetical protein